MRLGDSATTPEIVWTVVVTLALLVNGWALYDAIWDMIAARARNRHILRRRVWIIARANVRREVVQCIVQLLFVLLGLAAMLTHPGALTYAAPAVFITIALILSVNSIFDRADRHVLLRVVRRQRGTSDTSPPKEDFA
jgi:hypothetical protein